MRQFIVAAFSAVLTSLAGAAATTPAIAQGGPASVIVAEVEETELADTTPVIGHVVASVESAVAARTSGVVETVSIRVGDAVKQGDEIARLDPALLEIERRAAAAALTQAKAGVAGAHATLTLRRQVRDRAGQLKQSTAFSRGQFEDLEQEVAEAESALSRAEAEVESAKAALARADYNLTHTRILAPFDGVVLERSVNPGQYIQTGASVALLLDLSGLEIEADIPTDYALGIQPGLEVEATLSDGGSQSATLRAIIPRESVSTRTRPARFATEVGEDRLAAMAPGASVTLRIPTSEAATAVTAPKDALVQKLGGWMVFVVIDGAAQPRPVTLGRSSGGRIEILSGLEPGEIVVIRGNERLQPGQPVAPRPAQANGETQG